MSALALKYAVTDQQLDEMISDDHINDVSLFLPKWEQVANRLNVDRLQITDIQQAPGIDAVTRNHRVLTAWKNAVYRQATYRKLVEALDKLMEVKSADKVCELIRAYGEYTFTAVLWYPPTFTIQHLKNSRYVATLSTGYFLTFDHKPHVTHQSSISVPSCLHGPYSSLMHLSSLFLYQTCLGVHLCMFCIIM